MDCQNWGQQQRDIVCKWNQNKQWYYSDESFIWSE